MQRECDQATNLVVKGLTRNLLGLPAIMALDFIRKVEDKTDDYSAVIRRAHPMVF